MKATMIIGIILIVIGIVSLGYQGITYTEHEKVAQVGSVQVTAENQKTIPLPPIVGGAAILVGIVLVVIGRK